MRRVFSLCGIVLLSACEALPIAAPPELDRTWQERRESLSGLKAWTLTGRISITHEKEAWHATVRWHQHADRFDINLIAPLGQGSLQLRGNEDRVVLHTSEHETIASRSAEELLYHQLGWYVPVNGLRFWARGIDAPDSPRTIELDDQGRLRRLRQSGWEIDFRRYVRVDDMDLPGKMFLHNPRLDVRLVVQDWKLGSDSHQVRSSDVPREAVGAAGKQWM